MRWQAALQSAPLGAVCIGMLALVLYGNSLGGGFVRDDVYVITHHEYTRAGIEGIPRLVTTPRLLGFHSGKETYTPRHDGTYRPLPMILHALVFEFAGERPLPYHVLNVLLYAAGCCLLLWMLRTMLGPGRQAVALAAALVYTAHPVHTEVVSNIKGLDEILALIFFGTAIALGHRYVRRPRRVSLAGCALAFLAALLCKESTVTLLAILPLSLAFFARGRTRQTLFVTAALVATLLIATGLRFAVMFPHQESLHATTRLDNPLVAVESLSEWLGTSLVLVARYLRLLVWPHPLVSDYSYDQIPLVSLGGWVALSSLGLCTALVGWAMLWIRSRPVASFSLLFMMITILAVANFPVRIGTIFAERLLFLPSVGFALLVAMGLGAIYDWLVRASIPSGLMKTMAGLVMVILLSGCGLLTIRRNVDWKDAYTLWTHDVINAPRSVRANYNAALVTAARGEHAAALEYFTRATVIDPTYVKAHIGRGQALATLRDYTEAARSFERALTLDPSSVEARRLLDRVRRVMAGQGQGADS